MGEPATVQRRRYLDLQKLKELSKHPERLVGKSDRDIRALTETEDSSKGLDFDESIWLLNDLMHGLKLITGDKRSGRIDTPLQATYAARLCKAVASEVEIARANKKPPETSFSSERILSTCHRVARYEGLTTVEIIARLPKEVPDDIRELLGVQLSTIAATDIFPGNKKDYIDEGSEAEAVASLFYRTINHYLHHPHQAGDAGVYSGERYLVEFEAHRDQILKSYEMDGLSHSAVDAMAAFPMRYIGSLRGGRVFYDAATTIEKYHPELLQDRKLDVLYPASGEHLAPLLTAFHLVDDGKIDQANFIFTDTKPELRHRMEQQLLYLLRAGIVQNYTVFSPQEFPDGGNENRFSFEYKGKKITICLALNRSGASYWRPEYAQKSEWVIFHDPGTGTKRALLPPLLQQRKEKGWKHPQVVLMEARERESKKFGEGLPARFREIKGQYGHCDRFAVIDTPSRSLEIDDCFYQSAGMFSLP